MGALAVRGTPSDVTSIVHWGRQRRKGGQGDKVLGKDAGLGPHRASRSSKAFTKERKLVCLKRAGQSSGESRESLRPRYKLLRTVQRYRRGLA